MRPTNLSELFPAQYTFKKLFAMTQCWKNGDSFSMLGHDRPTNAFLYFTESSGSFFADRERKKPLFRSEPHTLVYIPKGSRYIVDFSVFKGEISTYLLEFELYAEDGAELFFGTDIRRIYTGSPLTEATFAELSEAYRAPLYSPSRMQARVYDLFYELSRTEFRHELSEKEYGMAARSITRLEEDPECRLNIAELAALSGISEGTFNSLFVKYSGMTPGKYRKRLRLEKAKELLALGRMSVGEIAAVLGFCDEGYFCRFFKKETGMTPKQWAGSTSRHLENALQLKP